MTGMYPHIIYVVFRTNIVIPHPLLKELATALEQLNIHVNDVITFSGGKFLVCCNQIQENSYLMGFYFAFW